MSLFSVVQTDYTFALLLSFVIIKSKPASDLLQQKMTVEIMKALKGNFIMIMYNGHVIENIYFKAKYVYALEYPILKLHCIDSQALFCGTLDIFGIPSHNARHAFHKRRHFGFLKTTNKTRE